MDVGTARIIREIKRKRYVKPTADERVGPCHYSKSGWAVWRKEARGASCTCLPARKPTDETAAYDAFDAWANSTQ